MGWDFSGLKLSSHLLPSVFTVILSFYNWQVWWISESYVYWRPYIFVHRFPHIDTCIRVVPLSSFCTWAYCFNRGRFYTTAPWMYRNFLLGYAVFLRELPFKSREVAGSFQIQVPAYLTKSGFNITNYFSHIRGPGVGHYPVASAAQPSGLWFTSYWFSRPYPYDHKMTVAVPSFRSPPDKQGGIGFLFVQLFLSCWEIFFRSLQETSSQEPLTQNWVIHSTPKPVTAEGSRTPCAVPSVP